MQTDKWKTLFLGLSTVISIAFGVMMLREQDDINHRLDVRDAYFNKGLIDGAKAREEAFIAYKRFAERMLTHCKTRPKACELPNDLTILPETKQFDPLERILTTTREK